MAALFSLPNELILSSIFSRFPCRDQQIRALATLLSIRSAPCRNIILHGLEATGKSATTKALLEEFSSSSTTSGYANGRPNADDVLRYAVVKSAECISGRHLLEQTVGAIAKAVNWKGNVGRCENISQLVVEIERLLGGWHTVQEDDEGKQRFVLVFDGIDRQRDAPPTLLPALARLGEIIPHLTTVFITTSPRPNFLHYPGTPHIHFPAYTKPELLLILSHTTPSPLLPRGVSDTQETWSRFCAAVWDALCKPTSRDILSLRNTSLRLWPIFIQPILSHQLNSTPFTKLLLANRSLFQNENAVENTSIINTNPTTNTTTSKDTTRRYQGITSHLPHNSKILLISAYLASFNPPRTDITLFIKSTLASKRRRRGPSTTKTTASKSRKISRKLLGPQAFVLERCLAIFHAIREDARSEGGVKGEGRRKARVDGSADIQTAFSTLASLRLVIKMGSINAGDVLDAACRYRVAVGWEMIRGIGRSIGIEVEEYLVD